jgi:hypothetical protein
MLLISIETTPNPNSMKLNFDEQVDKPVTYTAEQVDECEGHIRSILSVYGVKSVFVCANFITLNRDPRVDWKQILDAVTASLSKEFQGGGEALCDESLRQQRNEREEQHNEQRNEQRNEQHNEQHNEQRAAGAKAGQAVIVVQTFKGVPIQVKVTDASGEKRLALDAKFSDTAQAIQAATGADYLKERHWADWGVRYGTASEIAAEVVEEINARLDSSALERLLKAASGDVQAARNLSEIEADLKNSDWASRLKAVQELSEMKGMEKTIPLLISVLADEQQQVRRLAAAALGASGDPGVVNALAHVFLKDAAPGVRRTAGDALSDIGSAEAESFACIALADTNKLVRWRAARLLADLGTDYALPHLRKALGDSQFEVNLEIESAIERISGGKEASLPMWKKIQEGSG